MIKNRTAVSIVIALLSVPAVFEKAIAVEPGYRKMFGEMVCLTIETCSNEIKNSPRAAKNYFRRGIRWQSLKNYREALKDYNRAIELDPERATYYSTRAFLKQLYLKDYQGALDDYDRAIVVSPDDSWNYISRAKLKSDFLELHQSALNDLDMAIKINPGQAAHYLDRADFKRYKLNDYQGALDDYNQAQELNPQIKTYW
jgi:tetratricopeptide (TPR) repeat protein